MADPCKDLYEDYSDAYDEWDEKDDAAIKGIKNVGVTTGGALALCVAAWWNPVGLVGCAVAGANALNNDYDSIEASLARNEAAEKRDAALAAYKKCVQDHKKYYKQ
jgi:esterase/lipase